MKSSIIFISFVMLVSVNAISGVEEAKSFINSTISFSKLSQEQAGKDSKESKLALNKIKEHIIFSEFSKRALGNQYSKIKKEEYKEFTTALENLIELTAFPKARFVSANEDSLKFSKVNGSIKQILISGKIEREKDGDLIVNDFNLTLYFNSKNKIYDLKIEEELLSSNIASQIEKNLKKKTFTQLLDLMKKRVEKLNKKPDEKKI